MLSVIRFNGIVSLEKAKGAAGLDGICGLIRGSKANQLTAGQSANSQEESSNIEGEEEVEQSCETAGGCVRLIRSPSHPTSRQSHRLASSCKSRSQKEDDGEEEEDQFD